MKKTEVVRENSDLKKRKGITLISLVITIIILLILAGVTITTLTGENGLLKRASNAAEATQKETATEKMNFKITNIQINTYAKEQRMPTLQEIADAFYEDNEIEYVELASQKTASKEKIEVGKNESIFTKLSEYPYEFEIDSSLRLASINGVKVADNSSDSEEIATLQSTIEKMNQKISDLETEITTLKQKDESLEQKDTSLENSISNINTAMGTLTFTQLASTTATSSTNTVTLSDNLSNYKYVMVVYKGGGGTHFPSGFVSVDMFKAMTQLSAIGSGSAYIAYSSYVSNTQCKLYVSSGSNGTAIIYGVK